ncbi:MAG TPA: tetratricopeptide repeat protein [Bacteroidia bacterium]|nr:tetratricopeptide repeat protein [Bacteroidia bacterium]
MAKVKEEKDLDINETIDKAESYIQENKKSLSIIGGAVLVVVAGYFIYTNMIVAPQEKDAEKDMFFAEQYFGMDSMKLALNGDGNKMGFIQIIENYGSSQSANLAHYYAGICYLKTGDYQNAIDYLDKYDAEDDVTGAIALGGIGDAYLELGKKDEALKYYKKAIDWDKNQFTACLYIMKAAMVHELNGDYKSAQDLYERIKKDYPASNEAREVDRYIARAQAMVNK